MPSSRRLIASNTLTSSAASVTFSSIPGTYTDLVLKISARTDFANLTDWSCDIRFNSDSGNNYSYIQLNWSGTNSYSGFTSNTNYIKDNYGVTAATATSNTFGSLEIYIPSYLVSQNKPISVYGTPETNASSFSTAAAISAALWRNTGAITSIFITPSQSGNFVSGSSFFLYGLVNS